MKNFKIFLIIFLIIISCNYNNKNNSISKIKDRAGNDIIIPKKIEKIICLSPSITEILIEIEEEDKTVLISDIKQGRCSKSIRFSNNIEIDKISAKFNNGTVLITIPKLKTPKNKINVE